MGSPNSVSEVSHVPLEMQRLMNSNHWGGFILGLDPEFGPSVPKADEASAHFAIAALKDVLSSGTRSESVKSYLPGSTFTPDKYLPGTAVIYHQETLFREESDKPMADMSKFGRRALPKRPTALELELDDLAVVAFQPQHQQGGGAVHRGEVRYGVIPPNYGRKHKVLVTISGGSINQSVRKRSVTDIKRGKAPQVTVDGDRPYPRVEHDPIPIGHTRHFKRARQKKSKDPENPDIPRLVKINRLEVLRFGLRA